MNLQEYLKSLKVDDLVTRFFHGAGFVTQSEHQTVAYLTEDHVWLGEKMEQSEDYKTDSYYCYSRITGKQYTDSFSAGMYHTIQLPNAVSPD